MSGTKEPGRGSKLTIYLRGIIPLNLVKHKSAADQSRSSDVHMCAPDGAEVKQVYVKADDYKMGNLKEVPGLSSRGGWRYKEGVVNMEGKPVVVTYEEYNSASAKSENSVRTAKIEPKQHVPAATIKSQYYLAPQKGGEMVFSVVMLALKEKNQQITFNGVEGGQMRRCVLSFDGDVPVLNVLYLDTEVLRPMVMENTMLPGSLEVYKPKFAELLGAMEKAELEPITTSKIQTIEELFLAKAQGISPPVEVEQKPPELKNLDEMLALALNK
jgi:non-homologous end joining protein Ku